MKPFSVLFIDAVLMWFIPLDIVDKEKTMNPAQVCAKLKCNWVQAAVQVTGILWCYLET